MNALFIFNVVAYAVDYNIILHTNSHLGYIHKNMGIAHDSMGLSCNYTVE